MTSVLVGSHVFLNNFVLTSIALFGIMKL